MKSLVATLVACLVLAGLGPSVASAQTESWVQSNSGALGAPAPRASHSFVGGDGQFAYLFGGYGGPTGKYMPAELWRYDYLAKSWTVGRGAIS